MEVTTKQMIDIALDAAGYLLAGGLWLVVYSAWQNRRAAAKAHAAAPAEPMVNVPAPEPMKAAAQPKEGPRSLEFVTFRGNRSASEPAQSAQPTESVESVVPDRRRNRAEVFAMARRMLEQGVSAERVKSELPVSDGELALLHGKN